MHPATEQQRAQIRSAIQGVVKSGLFILILCVVLFACAGRLDWWQAWVYAGLAIANTALLSLVLKPDLLAERATATGADPTDILLALLLARVGPLATVIVAGLDIRWGWTSHLPLAVQLVALGLMVAALALTDWAMLANKFFAAIVRIQDDRGHTVVDRGPYAAIRHPGYAGALLHALVTPLQLGSLWALLPAACIVPAIVVRTALEDRTLQLRLNGYADYARRVRYRLLPGVW